MKYFFDRHYKMSAPYGQPRKTAEGKHIGTDFDCPPGTPILAPESGPLHYQIIHQHGELKPDLLWPDGTWWPYSRYYEWWAGGVAVLFGRTYTYVFLHQQLWYIYERWNNSSRRFRQEKIRQPGDWYSYVTPEINWLPIGIVEGDQIGLTGESGVDDGPHLHMQVMKPGRDRHEHIDPANVFKEIR